jgi:aspartyl-tRNA(Asn)/glutamyl-tRNA(Gln) amidotransferase subunit C
MGTILTVSDVEHIAELAKLGLTEEEKQVFCEQLSAILEHFAKLQAVDTSAIPPTATVLPLRSVMRQDEVRPSLSPEEFLSNAPDREGDSVRVRAVLG